MVCGAVMLGVCSSAGRVDVHSADLVDHLIRLRVSTLVGADLDDDFPGCEKFGRVDQAGAPAAIMGLS